MPVGRPPKLRLVDVTDRRLDVDGDAEERRAPTAAENTSRRRAQLAAARRLGEDVRARLNVALSTIDASMDLAVADDTVSSKELVAVDLIRTLDAATRKVRSNEARSDRNLERYVLRVFATEGERRTLRRMIRAAAQQRVGITLTSAAATLVTEQATAAVESRGTTTATLRRLAKLPDVPWDDSVRRVVDGVSVLATSTTTTVNDDDVIAAVDCFQVPSEGRAKSRLRSDGWRARPTRRLGCNASPKWFFLAVLVHEIIGRPVGADAEKTALTLKQEVERREIARE